MCQYLCPLYPSVFVCFFWQATDSSLSLADNMAWTLRKTLLYLLSLGDFLWKVEQKRLVPVAPVLDNLTRHDLPVKCEDGLPSWTNQPTNHATNPCR